MSRYIQAADHRVVQISFFIASIYGFIRAATKQYFIIIHSDYFLIKDDSL